MIRANLFSVVLMLSACHSPANETALAPQFEPNQFESWGREHIQLPPSFAATLPAGDEFLLFAPGMFDSEAEDFWSYVFVMQFEQDDLGEEDIDQLFELYYDGLILAVADGRDVGSTPADVNVTRTGAGAFEASVYLIDVFTTMEAVELRLLIQVEALSEGSSLLRVQASPQPKQHAVWQELAYLAQVMGVDGRTASGDVLGR